ncbi:NAD synthetase [Pseudomonas sp. 21LCFQ02]|uniref:NAD synthetase n=1 Tax=Pseudomonas sp. 21LCFQ02 TaxID=2957505 RepID=UPI00209B0918|nr:NAD synthetase [Pseudomonas sp. 21LCFQ02]MCO8171379.1 NAD synthetase [Pseudomonas sp. 21LCFQ02]
MSQVLIGLRNTPSQIMARQRIEANINLQKLYAAIDAEPAIVGAGVVYIDAEFNVVTLREFTPICSIKPKRIILREAQKNISAQQFAQHVQTNPRESRLLSESFNTSMSCAGAVLGWIAIIGGTAIIPFTGGMSTLITAAGWAATGASSLQCVAGLSRVGMEMVAPAALDALDTEEWYQNASQALDIVALTGVAATGLTIAKLMSVRKAMTGRSWYQSLKNLNRQERKRLTDELLKIQDPALTPKLRKALQAAGELPKRYTSSEISAKFAVTLKDALGVGTGLAGSGIVQNYAIGLYEELAE